MAAVVPMAAIALTAGAQVFQGYSENKAARAGARADEENARLALKGGEQEAMDVLREARFQQGDAAASIGQGLVFGGSISTVLADSARAAEMDIERIRDRARGEAANYYTQASERRKAGKRALIGGIFNAVATAVGGVNAQKNAAKEAQQAAAERGVRLGSSGGTMGGGGGTKTTSNTHSWKPGATPGRAGGAG